MQWIKSSKLWISLYELSLLLILVVSMSGLYLGWFGDVLPDAGKLPVLSVLFGGIGGVLYLVRAIYLNACVYQRWSDVWLPWYFLRPFASMITGGLAWLVLSGGLIILDAEHEAMSTNFGFLLVAFIAGYNVDNFLKLIEAKSKKALGLEPTRASRD